MTISCANKTLLEKIIRRSTWMPARDAQAAMWDGPTDSTRWRFQEVPVATPAAEPTFEFLIAYAALTSAALFVTLLHVLVISVHCVGDCFCIAPVTLIRLRMAYWIYPGALSRNFRIWNPRGLVRPSPGTEFFQYRNSLITISLALPTYPQDNDARLRYLHEGGWPRHRRQQLDLPVAFNSIFCLVVGISREMSATQPPCISRDL